MKHATPDALDQLEALLLEIRKYEVLKERKRGIFYRKSRSFLHFHEDPSGLFADIRCDGDHFSRHPVNTKLERKALIRKVDAALGN